MLKFFKRDKYDFIKITISILFSAIMVMFCSKVILTSYALPNTAPNTLTSGQNDPIADRVNLFPSLDGEEIIALNSFYATDSGGVKYIVYCLEKEKLWSPNQTLTKNSTPLDSGYAYIVQNGYPAKSLTGNDKNDEYLTRIAVWWYQDRSAGVSDTSSGVLTANQKSVIKASSYYQYIEPLVSGAVNAKNNPTVINPSFSLNSSSFKLSNDHTYLITDLIKVNSNVSFDSYRVSVNNSAVQILDENNSPVTGNINSGKGFKLRVNLSSIDNPITVNVSVVVNYSEYEAYSYSPPSNLADNMQQSFAAALVPVAKQKTISSNVSMPTGSLTIKKVDSANNSPLAGANIEVTRVITNQVVASFTSTTSDYKISNLLPGEYTIKETKAPTDYEIDKASTNVVITTDNLNVTSTITNSKINQINLGKIDSETKNYVAGATLKLTNSSGGEIETFVTTTSAHVIRGLASGTYYLEEVKAPEGYIRNKDKVKIVINDTTKTYTYNISNQKTNVTINKIDADTGEAVSGAILELLNSNKERIRTFTTTDTPYVISDLSDGTYYVREIKSSPGYVLDSSLHQFVLDDDNYNINITIENKPTVLSLTKTDASTGEVIVGATLRLTRQDGDMDPITFVSDSEPYVVKGLVPGIYALEEVEAPVGYVTSNSKIIFEVLETGKIQKVSLESDFVSISVTDKKLVIDTKGVDGYKFNLKNSSGVLISEIEVDKDGYTSDELENGDYSLEEVEVPDGNIKNTTPYYFSVTDSNVVSTINYTNDFTKVYISKLDITNSEEVEGATLVIKNDKGETVEEWVSTDKPHYIERLPIGKYTLTETLAPDGYVLNPSVVEFEVLETGDIQTATMFNSKPVDVPNTNRNANYVYIIGGILVVAGASIMIISKRKKLFAKSR